MGLHSGDEVMEWLPSGGTKLTCVVADSVELSDDSEGDEDSLTVRGDERRDEGT